MMMLCLRDDELTQEKLASRCSNRWRSTGERLLAKKLAGKSCWEDGEANKQARATWWMQAWSPERFMQVMSGILLPGKQNKGATSTWTCRFPQSDILRVNVHLTNDGATDRNAQPNRTILEDALPKASHFSTHYSRFYNLTFLHGSKKIVLVVLLKA